MHCPVAPPEKQKREHPSRRREAGITVAIVACSSNSYASEGVACSRSGHRQGAPKQHHTPSSPAHAARACTEPAPSVPYALHTPSHIFSRVRLWREVAEGNHTFYLAAKSELKETTFGSGTYDTRVVCSVLLDLLCAERTGGGTISLAKSGITAPPHLGVPGYDSLLPVRRRSTVAWNSLRSLFTLSLAFS